MLAREVFLNKQRIHGKRRIDTERYRCHLGHLLKHDGVMYRLERIFSPSERSVILHKNGRSVNRIHTGKTLYDDITGLKFILTLNLRFRHIRRPRPRTVELVGMSGTYIRQVNTGLSPCGSVCGMSMYNAPYFRKRLIQYKMGRSI